ncbi:sigma factor regulatory protein, FecR/PupR family [Leptospira inadai serovar Lyme str. 10]|uniref:Sigma factor regulatory protein, FecR/PupR family n=2 Tax=Leptospira inadai serovar Lyme TaxID=293084 RepID=V6HKE7_9LEPT|nr:FecR domain-containing protein [Leptospira inadai]EQA37345.1 sigma factor regulatory protein, FecR/PupR family [Leptospira inadai serovar Lyme str. 10]PNV73610.1 iron dicitrate transport regulator FecR [Leptospira inadai serovar Lyme]
MKKISVLIIVSCITFSTCDCGKGKIESPNGVINFLSGTVNIQRGEQIMKPVVSQEIKAGDILITGDRSVVMIVFGENSSVLEIQSNSRFNFSDIKSEKVFFQEKGSSWISTNKLLKGEAVTLQTPTVTAGVRGTKFYTGIHDDMTFICHCEGKVESENRLSHFKKVNDGDYLSVTKGDKTIYLTPKDLQKSNIPYDHDHSELENSPLGNRNTMSPEDVKKVVELVKKKLASN